MDYQWKISAGNLLKEDEEQVNIIASNLVNGMIYQVMALDATTRRFTYVSNTVERFYGCTADEAKANADLIYGRVHPDDLPGVIRLEMDALENMKVFTTVIRVFNPDGSVRWSHFVSKPRIQDGSVIWDGIEIDVTERKLAEMALREADALVRKQNDELIKLNADKDKLISILAHDLKSPFHALMGYSDLLANDCGSLDPLSTRNIIGTISKISRQTYLMLEQVLVWVKSRSGRLSMEIKALDLRGICMEVIENQDLMAETKQIIIGYTGADDLRVLADEEMLKTILRNLLSNAIKFSYPNGKVTVSAKKTEGHAVISVSDNGTGIEPEDLPHLFEIRPPRSRKGTGNEEGTGIGLSLCHILVERLGGRIRVESTPGKGSDFIISLPLHTAAGS